MENVIKNGFCELNENEMDEIDGGVWYAAAAAGIVKGCTVVGALVGGGPVIGGVIIVGGAAALAAGIYVGIKNN